MFGQGRPQFRVRKPRHAEALSAKRDEIANFVAERVDIQYVEAVRTGSNVREIVAEMLDRELAAAASDNEEYSAALAELRRIQQPVFDTLSESITARLQSLLPDVTAVRIEQDQIIGRSVMGRSVSVMVDDGTSTDLTLKGDGVQSFGRACHDAALLVRSGARAGVHSCGRGARSASPSTSHSWASRCAA